MVTVVNVLAGLITLSLGLLFLSWMIYYITLLIYKIRRRDFDNDTVLKILYIISALPFIFAGLYVIAFAFLVDYDDITKIIMFVLGLFLVIYPIIKVVRKIGDMNYFGGV